MHLPGGLQSTGSRRVGHDRAASLSLFTFMHWRRQWHPTPVLLLGKSHGRRSLVGCSPWGLEESDTTERLHSHFSLSCTGEGNGNPLQCSCLENPRDGGAWQAAVYGVAQSWTRLKWLSSSSMHLVQWTSKEADYQNLLRKMLVPTFSPTQQDIFLCILRWWPGVPPLWL